MRDMHCCVATSHIATHNGMHIFRSVWEDQQSAASGKAATKEPQMIQNLISYAQNRLEKRREFNRLANEISSLSQRDLADLRADRGEMLRHAYKKVYG